MPSSTDALGFYDRNHPWGDKVPLRPYSPDVEIERFHHHAKSGVLSQQMTTFMHCTIHTDAPARVIEGKPFMEEVLLDSSLGTASESERGLATRDEPREVLGLKGKDTANLLRIDSPVGSMPLGGTYVVPDHCPSHQAAWHSNHRDSLAVSGELRSALAQRSGRDGITGTLPLQPKGSLAT